MSPHTVQPEAPTDLGKDASAAPPAPPPMSPNPPLILIIGAGSRGRTYAQATQTSSNGIIAAVAEPDKYKRQNFIHTFITPNSSSSNHAVPPPEGSSFITWRDFISYETARRERLEEGDTSVPPGIDAVFICVLDEHHHDVVMSLAPLGLHIMCEKPLATTLSDCVDMYRAMSLHRSSRVFSIGHVLRYSPHNILLRKLLLEEKAIGDVLSIVHTEPVGWWHFSHSYVRGNWRREDTTAPSLLTKSCHDVDILLWLLCSPPPGRSEEDAHLPATVSSSGSLQFYKRSRKQAAAGDATNCLSCPIEADCMYSSKRIYVGPKHQGLGSGNTHWPVSIVVPDIENYPSPAQQKEALLSKLAEDYDADTTSQAEISKRSWFGRCVFESDNDVCDEQVVTMTWNEESDGKGKVKGSKQATFHMIAQTKKQCDRYSYVYGTDGEIYADSKTITVEDFRTGETRTYSPKLESLGHGGGDVGLTRQFILAVDRVKNHGWEAKRAQTEFIGCSLEEVLRSHAMVFAAEEARTGKEVVNWKEWWDRKVGHV